MREPPSIPESGRRLPIVRQTDVIVCGSGPAGVTAAIAAARHGASVCLVEVHGCLGGVWTAGNLSWVIESENKRGIIDEIRTELDRRGARTPGRTARGGFSYDVEEMKLLLEEMTTKVGVDVRLHTRVCAALTDENRRLTHIVTESKSGREAWTAKVFIDATGDGDLGAQAGCHFSMGHPDTGEVQPMSMTVIVAGLHADEIDPFIGGHIGEAKVRLYEEIKRGGLDLSTDKPLLVQIHPDLFAIMCGHLYGNRCDDASAISRATIQARSEAHEMVRALKSLGHPWGEMRIVSSGSQIGVREGRRIRGLYVVSKDDVIAGRRHEDGICEVTKGFDVHSTNPANGKGGDPVNRTKRLKPIYDIPLRALIAKDVDRLLLAGRCISGDFLAHASYRDTGNATTMGQAAGTLAALSAERDLSPRDVPWKDVREALGRTAALGASLA